MCYRESARFAFVWTGSVLIGAVAAYGQECKPSPDGFGCVPLVCSAIPEDQCLATVLHLDLTTGAIITAACECMNFSYCHIEFGDASPLAVGSCPDGHACEVFAWDADGDGINDHFAAECVPLGLGACCMDVTAGPIGLDTCEETDEAGCQDWYFVPVNTGCSEIEACCLTFCGETFCADLNRHCCILTGGVPLGPGSTCYDGTGENPCGQICGGFAGIPCEKPEEFCKLPIGHCCCDFMGICTPFPCGCPDVWEPVSGCDGRTYANECEADAVGVSIDHYGECGLPCMSNADCPDASLFCWLPAGACDDAGVQGICIPRPDVCPDVWAPVCGCDGQTYGNACRAHAAGVSIRHSGECRRVCGHKGPDPQCEPNEFCKYPVGTCGDLTALGVCTPIPDAC